MLNFKIGTIIRSIDKSGVDLPHAAKEFWCAPYISKHAVTLSDETKQNFIKYLIGYRVLSKTNDIGYTYFKISVF